MLSSDLASHPEQPILPRYGGQSILNLVSSLAGHFGVQTGHAPLRPSLPLRGVETVVLFVADGLGHFPLKRHLRAGHLPWLEAQVADGEARYATATSTFPSSTMTAMTTLHTGASPAQHGWLGTSIHAGGSVVDVLRQRDLPSGEPLEQPGALLSVGTPRSVGTLYRRLTDAGVSVRAVMPAAFEGSFLNGWYFEGATSVPYGGLPDLPDAVARAAQGGGPRYVIVYWPDFDTVSHDHGPYSAPAAAAARSVDAALAALLAGLPQGGSTLVVLTADHGQSDTPPELAVNLSDDGALGDLLDGPPAGESQVRYLNALPGRETTLPAHLEAHATVIRSADAWADGLFGGEPADETFRTRTGEYIAVAHHGRQLTWAFPGKAARTWAGTHGSWAAEQMVVPIVAIRR